MSLPVISYIRSCFLRHAVFGAALIIFGCESKTANTDSGPSVAIKEHYSDGFNNSIAVRGWTFVPQGRQKIRFELSFVEKGEARIIHRGTRIPEGEFRVSMLETYKQGHALLQFTNAGVYGGDPEDVAQQDPPQPLREFFWDGMHQHQASGVKLSAAHRTFLFGRQYFIESERPFKGVLLPPRLVLNERGGWEDLLAATKKDGTRYLVLTAEILPEAQSSIPSTP